MQVATQLSLLLANKVGALASVCRTLTAAKISIQAFCISDTVDHAVIRMVVDKPKDALRLLEAHGTLVLVTEVLLIEDQNKLGVLEGICDKLANAGISIEYAYCSISAHAPLGLVVLRPNDVAKTLKVLNKKSAVKTRD